MTASRADTLPHTHTHTHTQRERRTDGATILENGTMGDFGRRLSLTAISHLISLTKTGRQGGNRTNSTHENIGNLSPSCSVRIDQRYRSLKSSTYHSSLVPRSPVCGWFVDAAAATTDVVIVLLFLLRKFEFLRRGRKYRAHLKVPR